MHATTKDTLTIRRPIKDDGARIWRLVRESGSLDLNSAYAYLMLCDMFPDTCAVACREETIVGFATGFRKPAEQNTLFIWQIGVVPAYRGQGVGKRLVRAMLNREENRGCRYVEATVGPNNFASRQLFLRLGVQYGTECRVSEHYKRSMFPESEEHETELLYRLGPIHTEEGGNR